MKLAYHSLTILTAASLFLSGSALAAHHNLKENVQAALASDIRGPSDTARDANRMPLETLTFFGLQPNMHIAELMPGGGWYTKILAPVVAEEGQYYAAIGTSNIASKLLKEPGFEKAKVLAEDARMWREEGDRLYSMDVSSLGVTNLDMVLTFRNYHNFNEQGRRKMNEVAFAALKPGGIYAVVDHTARHNEPETSANRRRVDPVLAIQEIQQAGFELVDYSDLHYREGDELKYEVGEKSVTGKTDRWTFKFKKPD
ncbi:class I SAM-dependent methyltransferase [Paraglaciecola sp. L1A13]|uniref:class I SAM-dependent methyltransferase n=1 Tax=Paraglaciecola sp. L1A13 TaxID=2686359 RepID=UPI00131E100E|nr:methyltransferase [Paraglaciecola sp. L1A13]